jgi:hypothetical protein
MLQNNLPNFTSSKVFGLAKGSNEQWSSLSEHRVQHIALHEVYAFAIKCDRPFPLHSRSTACPIPDIEPGRPLPAKWNGCYRLQTVVWYRVKPLRIMPYGYGVSRRTSVSLAKYTGRCGLPYQVRTHCRLRSYPNCMSLADTPIRAIASVVLADVTAAAMAMP